MLSDPHLLATGFFQTMEHPSEGTVRSMRLAPRWQTAQIATPRPAPRLGEHTRQVLQESGFSTPEIDRLLHVRAAIAAAPEESA